MHALKQLAFFPRADLERLRVSREIARRRVVNTRRRRRLNAPVAAFHFRTDVAKRATAPRASARD